MKKHILFLLLSLVQTFAYAQTPRVPKMKTPSSASLKVGAFIDVNAPGYPQSSYNIQQLITEVLVSGGSNCSANVSNVIVSPNIAASNATRSWGYFNKGTTNFPFASGVHLKTGHASKAGNAFIGNEQSDILGTGSDPDLVAALNLNPGNLHDATYIQFDFVPVTSQISFQYIFASEEYEGTFPCTYTDAFALLIKKVADPTYTNIAVLPGGAGPVSVTNIRPAISGSGGCGALNSQYFAGYNTGTTETNYSGRTVPLTATATVVPGETYRFKMVLADYTDGTYDTGVFLLAGSFNIGVQLTDTGGAPLPANINICSGNSITLNATVQATNATYQWSLNGTPIPGATSSTYTANQPGAYSVSVLIPGSTCPGTATVNVAVTQTPVAQNASLSACSAAPTAQFDLTSAQPAISTTPGVTFSYYQNAADANAGNANTIPNPANYTAGTSIVYVRVANGDCAVVVQLQLTVGQSVAPVITASSTTICGSGSVTLSSNFTTGNTWSTGATTQSITVTTPGTYSLTNTNGTCSGTATPVTITQDADPNLQISGSNFFCTGGNTVLTASGTGTLTYQWSNGSTGATTTVNTPGTYTVTATTPGGCQFTESITITESPVPAAQNASLTECSTANTATFDLTAAQPAISTTPGVTFTYYTTLADANAGNTTNIPAPGAYVTPTATVYVRVSNGDCFRVVELQLTVVATPVPVITQSAPAICGNTPVTLTSNYTTGNVWSNGATTQSITVNTPGTYTLTVSNGNCVGTPVSVTVTQDVDPNVQITGQTVFCAGSFTTLTATATGAGFTYTWSTGATGSTLTVNAAGTYTVTVTTPSGCQFTDSITVTTEPTPAIVIAAPGQINCSNATQTLNASASTYQPGAIIQWTASGGGNIVSGANTVNPVVNQGGTYTLTITNPGGLQCSAQAAVTVVKDISIPVITVTTATTTVCAGTPVTLTASGAATYSWTGLPGSGSTQTVTPATTTTYQVTGVGANGCQGNTASITINVIPAIVSTLSNVEFCEGDSGILDAGAGPNYTYLWSTGATTQTITVTTAGTYSVTIDNGVCTKTFTAVASYTPVPVITEVKYENNTMTIQTNQPASQPLEYSLDSGLTWQSSNVFHNINPNATYTIWVRVPGVKCYGVVEYFTFSVVNAITPNDDGYNDYADFTGVSNYKDFTGGIFDRYGKEVFKLDSKNAVWKGNYQQFNVPTGTYWYKISWTDPLSNMPILRTGWIMVKNTN